MSLRDFIEQLEQLEDDYGDLDLPWELVREKPENLRPTPKGNDEVAEHISIDMGNAHAAKLPESEKE